MKKILIAAFLLLCALSYGSETFSLVINKKLSAVIVNSSSEEAVMRRINNFNTYVKYCTNQRFAVSRKKVQGKNNIVLKIVKLPIEKDDTYSVAFPDKKTMQITATNHSLSAAFNWILEEYFGVRFLFCVNTHLLPYGDDINHYPAVSNVSIPMKSFSKSASFTMRRRICWRTPSWNWQWNIKRGMTSGHMMVRDVFPVYKYAVDQSWPRNMLPILRGKKFVPPKPKGPLSKRPNVAARGYSSHWNPCFSHPDTTRIAIENLMEVMKKNPQRVSLSLGLNDNGGMCECAVCRKGIRGRSSVNRRNYSEIYWKWVNNVTTALVKKYPHLYVTALAYREVVDPPSFKLHKRVIPQLCFELAAMNYKDVRKLRTKLMERWKKCASSLDIWDYGYGANFFLFPRIFFKNHAKYMEMLHKYNFRSYYAESYSLHPFDGPKFYLMTKKLYDLNIDEEKIIQDWCDTAVGKKAGVYLRKYYDFWEKYWQRPEIQRTAWGKRRTGTYMPLGELPSHTYALRKGDMKYLRSLMDKVISLAGTDKEKRRAKILEDCFEISYLASKILFSEIFTPEGTLQSVEDVLALLKAVPESLEAMDKFHKNPYAKHYLGIGKLESAQLAAISMVQRYMHDKRVRAEVAKLEKKVKKPMLRAILKIWQGAKVKNLIVNGSFEAASPKPAKRGRWEGKVVRDQKIVSHGKYSLRLPQNCSFEYQIKTEPGKTYLFMMDLYGNESSLEGVVDYVLSPVMGRIVVGHTRYIDSKIPGGRWVTLSGVCSPVQNYRTKTWSDYMKIWITVRKFEKEEKIYLDNIRFICLDDVK